MRLCCVCPLGKHPNGHFIMFCPLEWDPKGYFILFSPIGGHSRLHFLGIQKGTFAVFFLFFFQSTTADDALCMKQSLPSSPPPHTLSLVWACAHSSSITANNNTVLYVLLLASCRVVSSNVQACHTYSEASVFHVFHELLCVCCAAWVVVYGRVIEALLHRQPGGGSSSDYMCGVRGIALPQTSYCCQGRMSSCE